MLFQPRQACVRIDSKALPRVRRRAAKRDERCRKESVRHDDAREDRKSLTTNPTQPKERTSSPREYCVRFRSVASRRPHVSFLVQDLHAFQLLSHDRCARHSGRGGGIRAVSARQLLTLEHDCERRPATHRGVDIFRNDHAQSRIGSAMAAQSGRAGCVPASARRCGGRWRGPVLVNPDRIDPPLAGGDRPSSLLFPAAVVGL
jgi:hypothetical protein